MRAAVPWFCPSLLCLSRSSRFCVCLHCAQTGLTSPLVVLPHIMQTGCDLHDVQEPSDSAKMCVQRLGTSRREGKMPLPAKFSLSLLLTALAPLSYSAACMWICPCSSKKNETDGCLRCSKQTAQPRSLHSVVRLR